MIPIILKDVSQKNREPRLLLAPAHLGPRDGLRESFRALGAPLLEPHGPHGRGTAKGLWVSIG